MQPGQPSRTARAAAVHRGVHQLIEGGHIFRDAFALRILDEEPAALVRDAEQHPERRAMRLFIAVRTRFAEDALAGAVSNGVVQLAILGAGLDTFAYRNPYGQQLRVFEIDHPATQMWKRQRLASAGIDIPNTLTFAPVDFERETLESGLNAAGFDPNLPSFFTWLGVVPYLSEQAIFATLGFIAKLPGGAHVVFDYGNPPDHRDAAARALHDRRAAYVAALGEAWISYFESDALHEKLRALNFSEIEDWGPQEIAARHFPERSAIVPRTGGHIIHASTR